jgi:hypothetical protein
MDEKNVVTRKQEAPGEEPFLLPPVDVLEDEGGITLYADLPVSPRKTLTCT